MKNKSIDPLEAEEQFLKQNRKEEKRERKKTQATDRSKYKKTNKEKIKKTIIDKEDKNIIRGRVLSILGEQICVESNKKEYLCTLRGVLKKDKTLMKNLIAVGDFVQFSKKDLVIIFVEDRFSILAREEQLRKKQHLIAVNIDQVLITVSVVSPLLKPALIDRYIIAAKKGNMTPIIVVNKIDLLKGNDKKQKEIKKYEELILAYQACGIKLISVSAQTKLGIEELKKVMKDKASVFSGQSGVGKSTLINLITNKKLKTGKVTKKTLKGAHVTTKAQLIPLKDGGFCIDTPGIRSFGVWNLQKNEIVSYFPVIEKFSKYCKYPNCTHDKEPQCAVKKAVLEKEISSLRFESYLSLMKSDEKNSQQR
jgi:ribosome biogenesis GTPase